MTAALRDRLEAAGIAAYRDERPDTSALPAVVLFVISDPRPSTYEGRQPMRETRVQLDCYADSRGGADALAEQVIDVCEPAAVIGGVRFSRAFATSVRTDSERLNSGSTEYRTSLDLMVWAQPAE